MHSTGIVQYAQTIADTALPLTNLSNGPIITPSRLLLSLILVVSNSSGLLLSRSIPAQNLAAKNSRMLGCVEGSIDTSLMNLGRV